MVVEEVDVILVDCTEASPVLAVLRHLGHAAFKNCMMFVAENDEQAYAVAVQFERSVRAIGNPRRASWLENGETAAFQLELQAAVWKCPIIAFGDRNNLSGAGRILTRNEVDFAGGGFVHLRFNCRRREWTEVPVNKAP